MWKPKSHISCGVIGKKGAIYIPASSLTRTIINVYECPGFYEISAAPSGKGEEWLEPNIQGMWKSKAIVCTLYCIQMVNKALNIKYSG